MVSRLTKEVFKPERWTEFIVRSEAKGISKQVLIKLCEPETRIRLYKAVVNGKYDIAPPHIARIPKDTPGEFREVYVNEPVDRVFLAIVNDCLCELFADMIHPTCKSYQKGIGTQEVVKKISKEIVKMEKEYGKESENKGVFLGYKADLSKYFDSVERSVIHSIFDNIESKLGVEKNGEPILNVLRKYYDNDFVFNYDNELVKHYGSLKQGCAVAAFLANVCLKDVDEVLSNMNIIYYRYSDDILMIGEEAYYAKIELEERLKDYGLKLNPKKVETLYSNKWFTFLGFKIKGGMITLSKNRVKNFQKEVYKRSAGKANTTATNARKSIMNYLYSGDYNWATSCLRTINVKSDIDELNKFIMDCLRACEVRDIKAKQKKGGKKYKVSIAKIGGLGSVDDLPDKTILRGTGSNVTRNRNITGNIEEYITVGCLSNDIKISSALFKTVVRGLR